jgi:GNAT superfamily N-acetyltransferase
VELRPTTAEDLPALHAVFLDSIGGLYRAHSFQPPTPSLEIFANQQLHIIETGGRSVVAERDGAVIGFGSSWERGVDWFLASLFVRQEAQAAGVGTALLDAVWSDTAERQRTITDAIQPVSNALYGRRGLIPATPVLAFSGAGVGGARPPLEPLEPEDSADSDRPLAAIDAAAYGFDRLADHVYWGSVARLTVWKRGSEAVAYSYAWPGGAVGPVAGIDAEAAAAALAGELAQGGGPVSVRIPGSSRALVATALGHGLRLSPTPGLLLVSEDTPVPGALAIGSYALY